MKVPNIDDLLISYIQDKTIYSNDKKQIIKKFRKIKLDKLQKS